MSIMRTLKKLVDPIAARAEAAERRGLREQPQRNDDTKVTYKCRVCDYASTNGEYCPDCLADTMVAEQTSTTK